MGSWTSLFLRWGGVVRHPYHPHRNIKSGRGAEVGQKAVRPLTWRSGRCETPSPVTVPLPVAGRDC